MLNEKFQQYSDLYSKYVDLAVTLHNYHYAYIKYRGYETSIKLRSVIRKMIHLQRDMQKCCLAAYKEDQRLEKERLKLEKLEKRANKLARSKKRNNKNGENI